MRRNPACRRCTETSVTSASTASGACRRQMSAAAPTRTNDTPNASGSLAHVVGAASGEIGQPENGSGGGERDIDQMGPGPHPLLRTLRHLDQMVPNRAHTSQASPPNLPDDSALRRIAFRQRDDISVTGPAISGPKRGRIHVAPARVMSRHGRGSVSFVTRQPTSAGRLPRRFLTVESHQLNDPNESEEHHDCTPRIPHHTNPHRSSISPRCNQGLRIWRHRSHCACGRRR